MRGKIEVRAFVKRHDGFSLTELVVAIAVAMILLAVGLPAFLRAYHAYELSSAANQVADILRQTRYEAIRLNTPVQCIIQPSTRYAGMTELWADSNANGLLDPTEKMILLGNAGNLVDSGAVPDAAGLIASAVGPIATATPSPAGARISFDQRGAVNPPTDVNVFYLASSTSTEAGFRAVFLMPAGSIQIWTGNVEGNWQQVR
jgi:prepilin-type N-terminal cleavage/methylation domain-containing protein